MKRIQPGDYAKKLGHAMRFFIDPATDQPIRLRGLQRMAEEQGTPYSYEHFRKVFAGEPVQSKECNEVICRILGLDNDKMWLIAQTEKSLRRFGKLPTRMNAPNDARMRDIWKELSEEDREDLMRIAEGYAARARLAERHERRYIDVPVAIDRRQHTYNVADLAELAANG